MLVCKNCNSSWKEHGHEYKRILGTKVDYYCSFCGCKKSPIEHVDEKSFVDSCDEAFDIPIGTKISFDTAVGCGEKTFYGKTKQDNLYDYEEMISDFISNSKPTHKVENLIKKQKKHLFIPDSQIKPGSPMEFLSWIGEYIAEKKPDVIIHAGDFADMESLSSHDFGKTQYEGRRYSKDIEVAQIGMGLLCSPFSVIKNYDPEMYLLTGNHETRITRLLENDPKLNGFISINDLGYEDFGWKVIPFLKILEIDGVHYSHYIVNPMSGKPIGGDSILTRLKNIGFSFVQGHQQNYLVGSRSLNNGSRIRGLVCGSCYLRDEVYRGPQSNNEWRGILMLHEVTNGDYSLMEVSLDFLCRKYEGIPVWEFMKKRYKELYEQSTWMKRQELYFNRGF